MIGRQSAEEEMLEGFLDGFDLDSPEPSDNRSRSYRHGFANGRDDRRRQPRASAQELRRLAEEAITADETA